MRLSICVPTYNRAPYLGVLFDSILAQDTAGCELELVVSDNASTDDTATVVEAYRDRFERLVYHRAVENLGADRNFLKVVELATGDWCWLMGSDDKLEPGAVARIVAALADGPDVAGVTVGVAKYAPDLRTRIVTGEATSEAGTPTGPIGGSDRVFALLGHYFGYLSAQVVDRRLWVKVVAEQPVERFFNAYVHIFVMGMMLRERPRWYWVREACVGWRSANDSFLGDGALKRMRIDVLGYEKIMAALFGADAAATRRVKRTVATTYVRHQLLGAKLNGVPLRFYRDAVPLLIGHYWRLPAFWLRTAPLLVVPGIALRGVRALYRGTVKRRLLDRVNRT